MEGYIYSDNKKAKSLKGKTLFDFADTLSIRVPTSCRRNGECHECIVNVNEGEENLKPKDSSEEFLTDSDNPKYLNLKLLAKSNSILNTPPTMSIFVLNLVTNWMLEMGGIDYFQNKAHEQSTEIYDFIDNNSDVLDCKVENKFRSKSNIVFNFLKDEHNKELGHDNIDEY